jgi:hypothetical protein
MSLLSTLIASRRCWRPTGLRTRSMSSRTGRTISAWQRALGTRPCGQRWPGHGFTNA